MQLIQPIVLVGGKSSRFGRDKLREPVPGSADAWLVDRPIAALREVFGPRVAMVGECHPDIAARGDLVICDAYPGRGPLGGIVSALNRTSGTVFVLSGDLPEICADDVRRIVAASAEHLNSHAVLAMTDRLEPCIALYRYAALSALQRAMNEGAPAHAALARDTIHTVLIPTTNAKNVNFPDDWPPR